MNETRAAILHSRLDVLTDRREPIRCGLQAKIWRRNSNNGVRLSFEDERPTDRVGAASVGALPQGITDDGNRRGVTPVFLAGKGATVNKGYAEHREQFGRDLTAFHILCSRSFSYVAASIFH